MDTDSTPTPAPIKPIDPHGDVVAVLPTSTPPTRLLISSKILSTASPVFRSMFSPRYREGTALASGLPVEVEFPDDPAEALETILNILHFRHNCVSEDPSHALLFEIALVVDKYDLTRALGPWTQIWLRGGAGAGERGLFVLYVLCDTEGFRKGYRQVVLSTHGHANDPGCEALPGRIVDGIAAARIAAIGELLGIAEAFQNLYQGLEVKCRTPPYYKKIFTDYPRRTCDAAVLGSLVRHYSTIGIFPVPQAPYVGVSVEGLASELKKLKCFVDIDSGHAECSVASQMVEKVDKALVRVSMLDVPDPREVDEDGRT